jgi:hypothetical protein
MSTHKQAGHESGWVNSMYGASNSKCDLFPTKYGFACYYSQQHTAQLTAGKPAKKHMQSGT